MYVHVVADESLPDDLDADDEFVERLPYRKAQCQSVLERALG